MCNAQLGLGYLANTTFTLINYLRVKNSPDILKGNLGTMPNNIYLYKLRLIKY